jgi:hypothetical protein
MITVIRNAIRAYRCSKCAGTSSYAAVCCGEPMSGG